MQWSAKRQRKVLNAALVSPITTEMIRASDFAVMNGYSGSLSRCVPGYEPGKLCYASIVRDIRCSA